VFNLKYTIMKKYFAEMIGTMVLVLLGCGSAIFNGGCGTTAQVLTVAFAFGLSFVAMAYAIGGISGCHINPAITLGCLLTGRISGKDAAGYMIAQVIGAILGSLILYILVQGYAVNPTGTMTGANAYGPTTSTLTAFLAEMFFTFIFVLVVLGVTDSKVGNPSLAGLAIGLTLVLIHIVCIPITGTSVNPARSIGPAIFAGGVALKQLWLFIVAPFVGAALSAIVWKAFSGECCKACKKQEE
jgi:aquaporin Z